MPQLFRLIWTFSVLLAIPSQAVTLRCERFSIHLKDSQTDFEITYQDQPDGELKTARTDQLLLKDDILSVSAKGYRIDFSVQSRENYLVLRIQKVIEPTPGSLLKLAFLMPDFSPYALTRLDYMSVPSWNGKQMHWPWIWARNSANPIGASAQCRATPCSSTKSR